MSVIDKENRSQHASRQKVLHAHDRRKTSSHFTPPHKQSKGCGTRSGRIDCPWRNGGNQENVHGQILDPHETSEEAKEWWSERYGYEYGYRFAYEDIVDDEVYIATILDGGTLEEQQEAASAKDDSKVPSRPLPSLDLMGMAKVKTKKLKPKNQSNEFEVISLPQVITIPEEDIYYYDAFPPVHADGDSDYDLGYVEEWEDINLFDFGDGDKKQGKQAAISYAQAVKVKAAR